MDAFPFHGEVPKAPSDPTASPESMQAELAWWLERLKKVDTALAGPALTMIAVAGKFVKAKDGIPSWITEGTEISDEHRRKSQLVHALCCSTLQRLWKTHRRYAWLTKDERKELEDLQAKIAGSGEGIISGKKLAKTLEDPVFGRLNPFLAAEQYWILLNAGENRVVGGSGLLLIFSMLWALFGTHPPESGFALGDTRTIAASVTAKCLRPIIQLQRMFRTRARLYREIRKTCAELRTYALAPTPHHRWQFAYVADHLAGLLLEMSSVAVNREKFREASKKISKIAAKQRPTEQSAPLNEVLDDVADAIADLREANKTTLGEASDVLKKIEEEVLPDLIPRKNDTAQDPNARRHRGHHSLSTNLRPPRPDESEDVYWQRMSAAARDALRICFRGLGILADAVIACEPIGLSPDPHEPATADRNAQWLVATEFLKNKRAEYDPNTTVPAAPQVDVKGNGAIEPILGHLAKANDEMANVIEKSISGAAYWCRLVVRQEVAYASAGNDTEFDAAELLSAVGVAQCTGHMSALEIEDAIVKALRALRQDGSWSSGQPIFVTHRVLGVWPNTSDIAWLLASAVSGTPKIRGADSALMAFVDFLDRTRTDFYLNLAANDDGDAADHVVGWSGETRESKSIDFWITAGAVNALIEIRQIIEHRLWELCERRFFVFRDLKKLDAIDPVDLGALHEHRLHHRLRRTARESSGPMYRDAEYSFVFHGPPGSSKTVMAEALGNQMWRGTPHVPRVIRITPADFTRQGEAGLDAEARFIFELLSHIRGVTIIFDEIDDLLRRRELKGAPEFLKMVVPAMLNRLQDLRDAAPRQEICFIIAMNYVDNVEPALIRPGRIDAAIPVVYPDLWSRDYTLDSAIEDRKAEDVFDDWIRAHVVTKTAGWPWPIYKRLAETVVRELKDMPSASWEEKRERVERLVEGIGTQKQDTASHYAEKVRWQPISPELINEVAHFAFAFFRTRQECSQQLNKILRSSPRRPDVGVMHRWTSERQKWKEEVLKALRKKLDREWDREHREIYSRAAARRTSAMGATHFGDDDGTAFRVWAPGAQEVRVVRGPGRDVTPLRREAENIFADEVRGLPAFSEYSYEIDREDGGGLVRRLDPAARDVNKDGSRNIVIEPSSAPKFKGAGWHELVVYQIHPGTFTAEGTYAAIADRLEKLEDLGINAIDLIAPGEPVTSGEHEYEWERFRKIDLAYGGLAGLRALIESAHAKSIAVFIGVTTQELLGRTVADLAMWDCYFEGSTPLGRQPVLSEKHVRDLMIENARRWVDEIGVDGIRWTGTHHVHTRRDETGGKRLWPEGLELIRKVKERIRRAHPTSMLIAQDDDPPHHYASEDPTSAAFNVLYAPEFERVVRDALQPDADLGSLQRLLSQPEEDVFRHMIFTESPETVREKGRLSGRWPPEQRGRQRAFLGTILSLVSPGIPVLLQGQELWEEPPIAGVPMTWDSIAGTYRRLKALIALRTNSNGRARGLTGHQTTIDVIKRVLVVDRSIPSLKEGGNGHHALAVLNFSDHDEQPSVRFPFSGDWHVEFNASSRVFDDRFGGKESPADIEVKTSNDNRAQVDVGGLSAVVLAPARRNA